LIDGHKFGLEGIDEATKKELYEFTFNGSTIEHLPQRLATLEKDKEGVAQRLRTM
jgi:hypothetical protein